MSLEFLHDTPDIAFQRTIADLRTMNPKVDASVFENMSITQIDTMMERLQLREQRIIDESPYGSWLVDPVFMQIKMLQDGLSNLREHRLILEQSETLVPGFTYYNGIRRFGPRIEGQMCMYLGEGRAANWINFIDSIPVMKALEVVKNGDFADFRRIYVEIANGRADGLTNLSIRHITESTDKALLEMETYCDARWDGPWPWEVSAPYRLGRVIEENRQMRLQSLFEMHEILNRMITEADMADQESFEIVSMVRGMSENVQGMIEKFAKLAGDAMINLRAAVMTQRGDEGAMKVEHGLTNAVNQAADALARLKVELDNLVHELGTDSMGMDMGMGGMGMGDQMGGAPGGPGMGGPEMGGDQMGGGDMAAEPGMGGPDMGAEPGADMGGDMNAAPPAGVPGGGVQPERPRKKA
jgi:hypothetical protein